MTREEIAETLKLIKDQARKSHNDTAILNVKIESFVWVIESAIQALSQEPITTTNNNEPITIIYPTIVCDDAISREAVDKYITELLSGYLYDEERERLEKLSAYLRELPSVMQKSGKWIMSDDGLYRPICNKCGAHPWKGYIPTVEEANEVFKYCPNCGAKMVEPQEDEKISDRSFSMKMWQSFFRQNVRRTNETDN